MIKLYILSIGKFFFVKDHYFVFSVEPKKEVANYLKINLEL